MSARHFVLWTRGDRTHLATRNAYRRGRAGWLFDQTGTVPDELVEALGGWEWQLPGNGPFPAFSAERLGDIVDWLIQHGYTAVVLDHPPFDPHAPGGAS